MVRKAQLPVIGGVRKVVTIPGSSIAVGTTIAEFGSNTVTLAQLAAALDLLIPADTGTIGGATPTAAIAVGPGLSGGGPLLGVVPINLTAPIPAFIFSDGGSGDGEPGPPGQQGAPGAAGAPGVSNIPGPAVFMLANDGEDGHDAVPGSPGAAGPQGNSGAMGSAGPAVFMLTEDGIDGEPGPPGPAGTGGSPTPPTPTPLTINDLFFWFKADPITASSGTPSPSLQNYCPWYAGNSANNTGGGATLSGSQLNSLNTLTFPGSSAGRYILPAGLSLVQATIFLVLNPASAAGEDLLAGLANSLELALTLSAGSIFLYMAIDNVAVIAINGTALPINTWTQVNATYNSSTGAYAFRAAQAAQSSGTSVHSVGAASTGIAYNPVTAGSDFNGQIAEMLVYGRALTLTEIQSIETYLHAKWGV